MGSGLTSFERAEQACLVHLGKVFDVQVGDGKDISIDDYIEPHLVNKGAFSISGGPEQVQNYGASRPGPGWFAYAMFLYQFETRAEAVAALGKLQKGMPPITNGCPGLPPNVNNFELMEHPEIFSVPFANSNGEIVGRIYVLSARMRVVYNNNTTQ